MSDLKTHEAQIERAERDSYMARGQALAAILGGELYRDRYQTFEDYCDRRWEITDRHARYLIDAAAFAEKVEINFRPVRLTHIMPLRRLNNDDAQLAVWHEVLEAAGNPRKVRASDVEAAVALRLDNPSPVIWSETQLARRVRAEAGECVVASMRADGDGQRIDEALLSWAEDEDRLVRVDRKSAFGNPFAMPDDGDRGEVIAKFEKFYWPYKPGLLDKISEWRGKVLVCWCHPEACHADVIAQTVNAVLRDEGTPQEIADRFADIDA